jgi:hypothetical protein
MYPQNVPVGRADGRVGSTSSALGNNTNSNWKR